MIKWGELRTTKHILVVDDDPSIVALMSRALDGYDVRRAYSGRQALSLASEMTNCDLLVTDYVMPTMSGDELAGRLREKWPALKTVFMTGYAASLGRDRLIGDACLSKPLRPSTLRQTVGLLIGPATTVVQVHTETETVYGGWQL